MSQLSIQQEEQIISYIKNSFHYAFGDIEFNKDRIISGFILGACFIDQMAGFRFNTENGNRFQDFIKTYLPAYDPLLLYRNLRHKLVHNYSLSQNFRLSKLEAPSIINRDVNILYLPQFIYDIKWAFFDFANDMQIPNHVARKNAIEWWFRGNQTLQENELKIETYNIIDATKLSIYYESKMKGHKMNNEKGLIITSVTPYLSSGDSYWVKVFAERLNGGFRHYGHAAIIAYQLGLPSPNEVLKENN